MDNFEISKSCFFTGHRVIPPSEKNQIRQKVITLCTELIEHYGVTDFIAGGALGFDTLAALSVIELKKQYPKIKLHLFLPCTDQHSRWTAYQKQIWKSIKLAADDYRYITNTTYVTGCMQLRNRAMVESAQFGIAYCTRNFGGTYSTVKLAKNTNRNIVIIK